MSRLHAVAAAAVLALGLGQSPDALALALGKVTVQSALGEPLRAEIDVPDISAEEAASLRVGLASSEAFRAAGVDASAALNGLQISLQKRPDGRSYLRLIGNRSVNEPFVDLIIEANWSTGRIVRDYTLLFDPPSLRSTAPAPLPPAVAAAPRPVAPSVRPPAAPAPAPAPAATAPAPAIKAPAPAAAPADAGAKSVTVRPGQTAGAIAEAHRPPSVSLDQMLVAMLRNNPNAFIGGNVNRIKAGAVIALPDAAQAGETSPSEARQTIAAQSRDFNEFRRRLAGAAPQAAVESADRQAAGRVQTEVKETKPAAPAADKLTLSKGSVAPGGASEEQIAKQRAAAEAAQREAELKRNITELSPHPPRPHRRPKRPRHPHRLLPRRRQPQRPRPRPRPPWRPRSRPRRRQRPPRSQWRNPRWSAS